MAYCQPGPSLSGQISTRLPLSGDQSVFSIGALAPFMAVVAQTPASMQRLRSLLAFHQNHSGRQP